MATMAPDGSGAAPPDMSGIGNVASAPKAAGGGGSTLQEFTVKRLDGGGVTICETATTTPPAGRRTGASFPEKGTYLETPFPDGVGVANKLIDLLGQLGVSPAPDQGEPDGDEAGAEGGPDVVAAAGPNMVGMKGPRGAVAAAPPPDAGY